MNFPLRILKKPKRTFSKKYLDYKSYKIPLSKDFNSRCGYCDVADKLIGDSRFFHIDHFAPKSKFPLLETEYSNLVYSCPYCNLAKSDYWVSDSPKISILNEIGFIDPCHLNYEENFCRNKFGGIEPKTKIGKFMFYKLNFYLERHSVLWNLNRIYIKHREIGDILKNLNNSSIYYIELKNIYYDLSLYLTDYLNFHLGELN